ncbi:glutathione S-transferase family protein [Rhizobiales bacterium]|uniref:glutathione S-transferase family protein n=1 Tax=Hongsoonwoonella zoysiae TaxID=2821844 RepID=UPI00155FB518|nr:glutathione S-transferase family protein [Hongsoonwoonella zoysiae]NRG17600.1 glutathione S-transferase family protein [Hongsoonwoonella zoysiae]
MGYLANGEWFTDKAMPSSSSGRFVRKASAFRNWVSDDGQPGPTGRGGFRAEPGRYHLIVSYACPWAHRTIIFRKLKKLEDIVSLNAVEPLMLENGWTFAEPDPVTGAETAWQVYVKADPAYSGRATVPILWDRETGTIVSNESAEIIRMFNSAFNAWGDASLDFYPKNLRPEIDEINTLIYDTVNNGVYKSGFAKSQEAYEEAATALFNTLDFLEDRLSQNRYLMGDRLTEADWRLFTTLVRFDPVYHGHFKCNIRRIIDYPNLYGYLRDLYQVPGIAETVDFDVIKRHYYGSHESVNPSGVVPIGPDIDLTVPHRRQKLAA